MVFSFRVLLTVAKPPIERLTKIKWRYQSPCLKFDMILSKAEHRFRMKSVRYDVLFESHYVCRIHGSNSPRKFPVRFRTRLEPRIKWVSPPFPALILKPSVCIPRVASIEFARRFPLLERDSSREGFGRCKANFRLGVGFGGVLVVHGLLSLNRRLDMQDERGSIVHTESRCRRQVSILMCCDSHLGIGDCLF